MNDLEYTLQNKVAWDRQSKRYWDSSNLSMAIIDFGDNDYPNDEDLNLIGDVAGKRILELGCGNGNISINLARRGAIVKAVDISNEQIASAKVGARREKVSIDFEVSRIEDYEFGSQYDMIVSICALQYVRDLKPVFSKIYGHLDFNGTLIFSTNHPAYDTAAFTSIWKDECPNFTYSSEAPAIWKWKPDDNFDFITFSHPIEYYINSLCDCGFRIQKLHELFKRPEKIDYDSEESRLDMAYPRFFVLKAMKC